MIWLTGACPTPEERLEVIRQLRAAGVARVHGDVHRAARVQLNLGILKDKALDLGLDGQLDGEDLLRHYGQHLQINAVELIKASPSSGGRQTLYTMQAFEFLTACSNDRTAAMNTWYFYTTCQQDRTYHSAAASNMLIQQTCRHS